MPDRANTASNARLPWWKRLLNWVDPALLMLIIAPLMIAFAWWAVLNRIALEYQTEQRLAYHTATSLSRSFGEQTARRIDTADQVLRAVRRHYLRDGPTLNINQLLADMGYHMAGYVRIRIGDSSGNIVATSAPDAPPSMVDRDYFKAHLDNHDDTLFIGQPFQATSAEPFTIQLSRRIEAPDGKGLVGVVMMSLRPNFFLKNFSETDKGPFVEHFRTTNLGPKDVALLLGRDGVSRVRLTGGELEGNVDLSRYEGFQRLLSGNFLTRQFNSRVDNIERYWAGGQLANYPLLVVVGIERDRALADYYRIRQSYLVATTVFSTCLSVITLLATWLAVRQRRTLRQLAASEREVNEFRSSFVAKITHDLKTPLNGVIGFADLIRTTAKDPDQRQYGEYILNSANHLLALVNTILDLTRLRASKLQLQLAPVDLRDTAISVSNTHRIVAQNKGLTLNLEIADDFPEQVICDAVRVREILNNLLNNAIKFTDSGSVSLTLKADAEAFYIVVRDTGIGMSSEAQKHLFEFFQQKRDAAARANAGSGLGLAFSQELIRLHGGQIDVQSRQGEGTTMTVRFPRTAEATHEP